MNFITIEDFNRLCLEDSYYNSRWSYFEKAIEMLSDREYGKVLELGGYKSSIVTDSDTMDFNSSYRKLTLQHDARTTPWPIEDKKYDLFIALQVWEHLYMDQKNILGPKQQEAFAEVMRVSKNALLSFPYKWNQPGNIHHGIDENKINVWTLGIEPKRIEKSGTRILYLFNFES